MQLKERAKELRYKSTQHNVLTTNECGLHLLTNSGEILEATYKNQNRFAFKIPENTTQIQLISHSNQPNQSIGPFVDDRRQLGILIGKITLLEGTKTSSITEHLTSTDLEGWHPKESNDCRWTDGNASFTIKQNPSEKTCMLIIHVLAAVPYKIENIDIQKLAV